MSADTVIFGALFARRLTIGADRTVGMADFSELEEARAQLVIETRRRMPLSFDLKNA